jgi:hypothetical protein
MATRFASNGTLRYGTSGGGPGALIAKATDIQIQSTANREYVVTNSGESGPTDGIPTVKITGKCKVAKASAERKRLMRIYQAGDVLTLRYRSGDMDYIAEGVLDGVTLASSTNKADEFDFEFMGTEQPIQDV